MDISKALDGKRLVFIDCLSEHSGQPNVLLAIDSTITRAIGNLAEAKPAGPILLVLDSPDLLLACGSTTAPQLNAFMLRLRGLAHAVVLTCSADQSLLHSATPGSDVHASPLESEGSSFLTTQAHHARMIISVRELATGAARDISGVLRATRSACAYNEEDAPEFEAVVEMEALYLVQRDGGVKVFRRGADSV